MFSLDTVNSNYPTFAPKAKDLPGTKQFTQDPINIGTSILGVAFNGGVAVAADTLVSYGSLARYSSCTRVVKVNEKIVMAAGGDFSDFQYVQDMIQERVIEDQCIDDGFTMKPKSLYNWLTGTQYHRRSKFNPLWNDFLIAGLDGDSAFLGHVDKLGAAYQDEHIATGLGRHIALPLLRSGYADAKPRGGLTEAEACKLLEKCMEVLYYRDARSWPEYHVGIVTKDGVKIQGPLKTDSNWEIASYITGYE